MNAPLFLLLYSFLAAAVFAVLWCGGRWLEKSRKQQLRDRLGIVSEQDAPVGRTVFILTEEGKTAWHVRPLAWSMSQVEAAGLKWSGPKVLAACLACSLVGAMIGARLGHFVPRSAAAFAFVPTLFLFGLPFLYLRHLRTKRLNRFEGQLPDALDFIARSLRVGNSLLSTLETLVEESEEPLQGEFRRVTNEIRLGSPIAEPLQKLVHRVPLVDLRMFVSAVLLQRETGGNLGALLTRIAASIRDRFRVRGKVVTAASQAQLSARVISAMPFVVLGGILVLSPGYIQIMTVDPLGRKLLAAAAIGQFAGFLVMRKIVRIKV